MWKELSPEEKSLWEAESRLEDSRLLNLKGDATMDDVASAVAQSGGTSRGREMAMRREVFLGALGAMTSHHAWENGLVLCSTSSALRPERVLEHETIPNCKDFVKTSFGHDDTIVPNPKRSQTLQLPCTVLNWGLCSKDVLLGASTNGTLNLYRQLQQNHMSHAVYLG